LTPPSGEREGSVPPASELWILINNSSYLVCLGYGGGTLGSTS
jgi:hypothetical protein